MQALSELARILRTNGTGLVYVRSVEVVDRRKQLRKVLPEQDFLDSWHLQQKYEGNLQQAIEQGHQYVPEKHSVIYKRYYHAYRQGELE